MEPASGNSVSFPDYIGQKEGFYLCAQKHDHASFSLWDERPCVRMAIIRTGYGDPRWFDAVTDGEGGAIVVYFANGYQLWAQRISAGGLLMWDSR